MQRGRSTLDSFPEPMDLNQESLSNNTAMNQENLLNPVENRLSNHMLSSGERSISCTSSLSHNPMTLNGWDRGESSSSSSVYEDNNMKLGQFWSTTTSQPEPYGANHLHHNHNITGRVPQDSSSTISPLNTDLCGNNYLPNDTHGQGSNTSGVASNFYWPNRFETSSSSSGYMMENNDGSGSSSCKRKTLEGSSSSNPPVHTFPTRYNASTGINISSSSPQTQQMNSRNNGGIRTHSEIFPPLSINESSGNVNGRLILGSQEPDFFGLPFIEATLRPPPNSTPRAFSMNPNPSITSHINNTHVPGFARTLPQFPWNGSLDSQGGGGGGGGGGSSESFMFSGNRGLTFRDESSARTRNNIENPDPTTWNLTPGIINTRGSRNGPSSSRNGPRTHQNVWTPHQNANTTTTNITTTHNNQQGITEYAPWTLFPPLEPEYGGVHQRSGGLVPVMPNASSASEDAVMLSSSSRRRHQPFSRSPLLMDATNDAITGWRALADMEGRHRLIRQVLNAVRRGDNLRAQDFAVFDPFISGAQELHDRHSNMRLDVDNMSYEELLALEEHIGNVSTGLSEETIMSSMKQQNYHFVGSSSNTEPCCICQEEYVVGDEIGTLDCAHEFHTNCIKQWLLMKNLCPICKMTGLET